MRLRLVLSAAFLAAFCCPTVPSNAAKPTVGLILRDNVPAYARPSGASRVLAVLVQQTQVEVLRRSGAWEQVKIWAALKVWVRSRDVAFRQPWSTVSTYRPPEVHYALHATGPQPLHAAATLDAPATLVRAVRGSAVRGLRPGSHLEVSAWAQDSQGKIWYRVAGGWVLGDAVRFAVARVRASSPARGPTWAPVRGKGMWLTLGTIAQSDPNALVQAAIRNGITHLYLEAAISPLGFHGKKAVGPLMDSAHRHHLAVVAWVFPYLYDVAADVALTRRVAAYHTASGARFDGIALDLERNVQFWNVRALAQITRAYLGRSYLLVGVTYPPQDFPGYPFAELARTCNVLAPMDYWHQSRTPYGPEFGRMPYGYNYAYRYAAETILAIRRAAGSVPVEPIGQTFDNFGHLEMGPHAPSAAEITGFLAGSKATGAVGVSFFQWMTAQDGVWRAIQAYRF